MTIIEYLSRCHVQTLRHFVSEASVCLECSAPIDKHHVVNTADFSYEEYVPCWISCAQGAFVTILREDHPNLMSLNEFEELYSG